MKTVDQWLTKWEQSARDYTIARLITDVQDDAISICSVDNKPECWVSAPDRPGVYALGMPGKRSWVGIHDPLHDQPLGFTQSHEMRFLRLADLPEDLPKVPATDAEIAAAARAMVDDMDAMYGKGYGDQPDALKNLYFTVKK